MFDAQTMALRLDLISKISVCDNNNENNNDSNPTIYDARANSNKIFAHFFDEHGTPIIISE